MELERKLKTKVRLRIKMKMGEAIENEMPRLVKKVWSKSL
jgi:hypothetical protein